MNDILRSYDCSIWGEGKGLLLKNTTNTLVRKVTQGIFLLVYLLEGGFLLFSLCC